VTRYSAVSGKTLIAALKGFGVEEIRVRDSHQWLSNIKIQRPGPKMPDECTGLLAAQAQTLVRLNNQKPDEVFDRYWSTATAIYQQTQCVR
jgi:hypothetical protein